MVEYLGFSPEECWVRITIMLMANDTTVYGVAYTTKMDDETWCLTPIADTYTTEADNDDAPHVMLSV